MADFPIKGRGFAPQAGSYKAYQGYQQPPVQSSQAERPSSGNPVKAVAALTGAGLSLAIVIGVGVWSYQLIARDVAGVPVVRAVQGEMRIRPAEPGGAEALNQGLAVNNVAAAGGAAGPSERIVLAPEPIDLSNEDTALIDQLAAAQPRFAPDGGASTDADTRANGTLTLTARVGGDVLATDPKMASIEALAAKIAAGATPLTTQGEFKTDPIQTSAGNMKTEAASIHQVLAPVVLSQDAIATNIPGVTLSLRPKLRPQGVRTASLNVLDATSSGVKDVDPASIPAGTRLVQLGAYESPEIARNDWMRFTARFGDYMAGKDRVVQRATSGGRTFYRLRAMGFSDLGDARRFCSALTAQNTDCIPVVTR
jgi:hypothetical protein